MDAVSDVLRAVRLSGAVYLNGTFTAPWCVIGRTDAALCAAYLPRSERVVSYHLIIEGSCWAQLADDPDSAIHLNAGELLVVPQGETHLIGSAVDIAPTPADMLLAGPMAAAPGDVMTLSYGGGGATTRIVCGFLACDDTLSNPLLSSLPRLFKIDVRDDPRAAWLESSLKFAAAEAANSRAGGTIVLARLSELYVGRALSLLHAQAVHPWTVDELARKVGLSRSALAQRFTDLLGQPPMQYLARWRMQIAAQELLAGRKSLAAVAEQIGYESEAAFSRAFRREFGMPPAGWRKNKGKMNGAAESAQAAPAASGITSPADQ
jgi:AraC-like DNA-binding protein